ncbi:hypothetical protein N7448_000478 [Penicillium atrosanguineum]|uniref:Uncharacterized protein n=1 Tax=Penicillium atrosanguineum TaxID=1132637 RepID=A0A9W9HGW7_9EURO|nr:uncharacterized protein N7443_003876 [Penicillium atrosanguineum]KAJ5134502.1 hypothetical protein N7526_005867 [Penicillium atrosanguineum]KAJ5148900.1 hypothetical protein N7448_000478 [Penicillium atrosanguineum]KAJ5304216.1 hypothetical protein N7443_003876 [Penicillium atrosanguineum]KAJ5323691.1 hypothetical protein N7476_002291 [Penicillium atrosanguineum]
MNQSTMQPTETVQSMFAQNSGAGPPASNSNVETQRSMDPHVSLEDYNRTMLEYTQRQMSSFVDLDDSRGSGSSGRSGRSSGSSHHSGDSGTSNGVITSQSSAPPTSAGAAAVKRCNLQQGHQQSALSPNEANSPRY